jgi:hypothetical protein
MLTKYALKIPVKLGVIERHRIVYRDNFLSFMTTKVPKTIEWTPNNIAVGFAYLPID